MILQVLKLSGADEGEVGRIEEQQRPMTEQILLAYGLKCPVMVGLHGEIDEIMLQH